MSLLQNHVIVKVIVEGLMLLFGVLSLSVGGW